MTSVDHNVVIARNIMIFKDSQKAVLKLIAQFLMGVFENEVAHCNLILKDYHKVKPMLIDVIKSRVQ